MVKNNQQGNINSGHYICLIFIKKVNHLDFKHQI
jgi:hypothetical protein